MRVIAGSLKGRQFNAPRGHRTHPMGDKVRGALFSALGDIDGLTVLDAYAGSGALSIEALSRGAASALAIELDKDAAKTIGDNFRALGLGDRASVQQRNVSAWSSSNPDKQFDVVLADPPYDQLNFNTILKLATNLKEGGIMALSWPKSEPPRDFDGLKMLMAKNYGDAKLVFYRK